MYFKKHKLIYPLPFVKLIPSVITLLGLSIGISSIRYALESKWEPAIICVLIAAFIDGIDGSIARLLNATSSFGVELDSLCDFMNFGLSSSLIVYLWLSPESKLRLVSWGAILIFIICMAIRLARFNTNVFDNSFKNCKSKYFFVGVPAPVGGLLILMPIIMDFNILSSFSWNIKSYALFIDVYLLTIGFLMASRVPTFSVKNINVKPEYIWICLLLFATVIVALLIYPWYIIPAFAVCYICSIPVSIIVARKIN